MKALLYEVLRKLHHALRNWVVSVLGPPPKGPAAAPPPELLRIRDGIVDDKHVELPFVMECLQEIKSGGFDVKTICDVGGTDSVLPPILSVLGYNVVVTDIRPWGISRERLMVIVDDIKQSKLQSSSFDVVTAISSIEHVGIGGRYGENEDTAGDQKAIGEIYRILKPGGYFILTVPFGRNKLLLYKDGMHPTYKFALGRVYDRKNIEKLVEKFSLVRQIFFGPPECTEQNIGSEYPNVRYVPCSEAETLNIEPQGRRTAITCALFQKHPG